MKLTWKAKKLLMLVMVLISILMLVVSTYSWFASLQGETGLSGIVLTTENVVSFTFDSMNPSDGQTQYNGQTGMAAQGNDDEPYVASYDIVLDVSEDVQSSPVYLTMTNASITKKDGTTATTKPGNFTWRLTYTDSSATEQTVGPTSSGNIYLQAGNDKAMTLQIIYLSESDYLLWEYLDGTASANWAYGYTYSSIGGFVHSSDTFRGATFVFDLEMSVFEPVEYVGQGVTSYEKLDVGSIDGSTAYAGQTGKAASGANAPYTADFDVVLESVNSSMETNAMTVLINSVNVLPQSGMGAALPGGFTWRLTYTDPSANVVTKGPNDGAIYLDAGSDVEITLRIIFLSESDYVLWLAANYAAMDGFAYTAYSGANFVFGITLVG